eukprot:SAG11_NODE_1530_length_4737_cov_3.232643_4_plen_135_part_00
MIGSNRQSQSLHALDSLAACKAVVRIEVTLDIADAQPLCRERGKALLRITQQRQQLRLQRPKHSAPSHHRLQRLATIKPPRHQFTVAVGPFGARKTIGAVVLRVVPLQTVAGELRKLRQSKGLAAPNPPCVELE